MPGGPTASRGDNADASATKPGFLVVGVGASAGGPSLMHLHCPPGVGKFMLCVDDLPDVAGAMRLIIESDPSMECVGCLGSANDLVAEVQGRSPMPDVVVLDGTMPGRDPMQAMKELAAACPSTRTIIYSGHDDPDFVDRARDFGAWGCISKDAEPRELVRAVRDVAAGRPVWPGRSTGRE
jgi:DNA-binding NarL/FixJ family response regulator